MNPALCAAKKDKKLNKKAKTKILGITIFI